MLEELFIISQTYLKNYNQDYIRYFLKEQKLTNRFSIIIGQRGVGKTTMMVQYILLKYHDIYTTKALYLQADHILLGKYTLYEIADEFYKMGGELLCIDEIHKYSNWARELKSINDTFVKLKLLVSGSSALEITKGSYDLSRRALVYKIQGMSLREFIELKYKITLPTTTLDDILSSHQKVANETIDKIETKNQKILPLLKEYLGIGYYPFFFEYNDKEQFILALEQNINTTIESDLLAIYPSLTGNSIRKLKSLIKIISTTVPFTLELKKLKTAIGISDERTLKNYLKYLEDAGLIKMLQKDNKGIKSLQKPDKIYLDNPNLYIYKNANIGTIRETFFINQLSKSHDIVAPKQGDFLVDNKYTFEVGGKSKGFEQIKDLPNSFVVADDIEIGFGNKIPLWLFGFLY